MIHRCRPIDLGGDVEGLSDELREVRRLCGIRGFDVGWVRTWGDVTAVKNGCRFDEELAELAVQFVPAFCNHSKGEHAGQPFELAPWQADDIWRPLFGWVRPDGMRRFRTAYIEIPRKNGKTTLAAGGGTMLTVGDGEPGADVACAASNEEQAFELFREACAMVEQSPDLSRMLTVLKKRILHRASRSLFRVLTSKAGTKHGMNLHGLIGDEFHAWKDGELWDVLKTSSGARVQPLRFLITTAGFDRESICFFEHLYALDVIYGGPASQDDTYFGYVAAADEEDDWQLLETWIKANPGLGLDEWIEWAPPSETRGLRPVQLTEACPWRYDAAGQGTYHEQLQRWLRQNPGLGNPRKLDELAEAIHSAAHSPAKQNSVRRLYLNQWTAQEERWLDMVKWDACGDAVPEVEELEGRPCYLGYDLATRCDLVALAALFPPPAWIETGMERARKPNPKRKHRRRKQRLAPGSPHEGADDLRYCYPDPVQVEGRWDLLIWFWLPDEDLEERGKEDHVRYDLWAEQGLLRLCEGPTINQEDVIDQIDWCCSRFDVLSVAGDPWNGAQVVREVGDRGMVVAEVPQTFKYLNAPTKELMAMVVKGKLRHGGHKVLRWCADHVVVSESESGDLRPNKKKSMQKIDGVVATIIAFGQALEFAGLWERKKRARRKAEVAAMLGSGGDGE